MFRNIGNLVFLVWRSASRNRRRTILTVFSLAASLSVVGFLLAIRQALYFAEAPPEQALRLVVRSRVSIAVPLPVYYGERIAGIPGVDEVMYSQWFGGEYIDRRDPKNFFARFAVEPEKLWRVRPELTMSSEARRAFRADRTGCILGEPLARRLGLNPGDRLTLRGDIFPVTLELTVRGVFTASTNSEVLYFQKDYLVESLPAAQRDSVGNFIVRAIDRDRAGRLAATIDQTFRTYPFQTRTESEQAFALSFLYFLGDLKLFILAVSGALVFSMLLVCANSVAMSIRERIPEAGILKALGFTSRYVFSLLVAEPLAIALAGWTLAALADGFLCALIRSGPTGFEAIHQLRMRALETVALLVIAAAVGVLSAVGPALAAARLPVTRSIRFAG